MQIIAMSIITEYMKNKQENVSCVGYSGSPESILNDYQILDRIYRSYTIGIHVDAAGIHMHGLCISKYILVYQQYVGRYENLCPYLQSLNRIRRVDRRG